MSTTIRTRCNIVCRAIRVHDYVWAQTLWLFIARIARMQVSSFSQMMGYQMLAEAAEALGKHNEAATIRTRLAQLRVQYTKTYYDNATGNYFDHGPASSHAEASAANVQTSNSMALWLGIPLASERPKVVGALVENVKSLGHHLSTGIIGTRVLLPSLPIETAYLVATQDTYPGRSRQPTACTM
jgi:hypothetical protein